MKEKQMSLFANQKSSKKTTKATKSSSRNKRRNRKKDISPKKRPTSRRKHRTSKKSQSRHLSKGYKVNHNKQVSHNKPKSIHSRKSKAREQKQTNKSKKDVQSVPNNTTSVVQTVADKAYNQLVQAHLISKCHIYKGGEPCQSIALSYIDSKQTRVPLGEDMNKVCKESMQTKPYCYYRYNNGRFMLINGWLMNQIYKYRDDIK